MKKNLYGGLDVGTSGCKIMVYTLDGTVVFSDSEKYAELGENGHREIDPTVVKTSVLKVLQKAGEACGDDIRALAVASLGESIVCVDENGEFLSNSLVTGDLRGVAEVEDLIAAVGGKEIFQITGLPPNELYGLPKYMWLNKNTSAVKSAKYIFFYEDLVGYILTGQRKVSYSSAARSLAFDIKKKEWSKKLLSFAEINLTQMSEPVPPFTVIGTLLPEISQITGLNPNLKVVVGGHDQTCAAVGSGLKDMETSECGIGTCEFMFIMMDEAKMTDYMLDHDFTCIPYILEDTYLTSIETTTCGVLKNWARDTIFSGINDKCLNDGENFFAVMEDKASSVKTDVMVLPQFGSSGNPDLDMNMQGTITGLTIHTKIEEIYRALLESFSFQIRYAYELLEPVGAKTEKIVATGGGAQSDLTLQIRADVMNVDVVTLATDESGTLGCAMMAAVSDGAISDLETAIETMIKPGKVFKPRPDMVAYYDRKFQNYKIFYNKMHRMI